MKKRDNKNKRGISWWWILILIILLLIIFGSNSNYKKCVEDCRWNSDCYSTYDDSTDTYRVSATCYRSLKNCIDMCD